MTPMSPSGNVNSTLWSVVLRAGDPEDPHRKTALNSLCEIYWAPVHAYLRRKGHAEEDARDATQGFFAHVLTIGAIDRAERGRGRFRNYLLALLEHFLANERRRAKAQKRGAGAKPLPLDAAPSEPPSPETLDAVFRKSWALTVLERSLEKLRSELAAKGRGDQFEAVRSHLLAGPARPSHDEIARRLGASASDVANLLHRSRKRLGAIIRSFLRDTVETDAEVEDEVRELFTSLE
jgi:RNA polymerase sigma factor (sigma-70 family)